VDAGVDMQEARSVADGMCEPLWCLEAPAQCPLKVLQVRALSMMTYLQLIVPSEQHEVW
jgi:hypothetical protein